MFWHSDIYVCKNNVLGPFCVVWNRVYSPSMTTSIVIFFLLMVEMSALFWRRYLLVLCVAPPCGLTCLVHCFMLKPCVFMSHSCSCVWNSPVTIYLLWISILHLPIYIFLFFPLSLCPPSTPPCLYQMLKLALHPCSSLQAPPSLTLVPPRTKPKVSSAAM